LQDIGACSKLQLPSPTILDGILTAAVVQQSFQSPEALVHAALELVRLLLRPCGLAICRRQPLLLVLLQQLGSRSHRNVS